MSLRQETVKLSIITGFSIVGGFLFHILLARRFGLGWQLDCFFIALTLFNWFALCNTMITSLYLPIFNEVRKNSVKEGLIFADVVIKATGILSILMFFVTLIFDDFVIRMLAPGFGQREILLCKELNRIVMCALVFYGISNTAVITLNALYHYSFPALADLFEPVFNIMALFVLTPLLGIKGIALSCLLSNFFKSSVLLLFLYLKAGWRPTLRWYHPYLPRLLNKSSKITFNSFIWSLRDIIIRNIASRIGEGAVTLFSYAEKFINIFIQITINPLVRVFYSRISQLISLSEWDEVKRLFTNTVRINISLTLFVSACSAVFLPSLLSLFLHSDKFSFQDIRTLSILSNLMLLYFIILSFEFYLSRVIFAMQKTAIALISASLAIAMLFITLPWISEKYGIYALAYGIVMPQAVACFLHYLFIRKRLSLSLFRIGKSLLPSFLIAGVLLLCGLVARNRIANNLIIVFCFLPFWLVMSLIAAKAFLKEELKILFPR